MTGVSRRSATLALFGIAMLGLPLVSAPAPATASSGVIVRTAGPDSPPCPDVRRDPVTGFRGGCAVTAHSSGIDIEVLTVFGPMAFERCSIQVNLYIGPSGQAWTADFGAFSVAPDGVCGDIVGCSPRVGVTQTPWRGEVRRAESGEVSYATQLCLDTCMGRFEGQVVFDLRRAKGGWRMHARKAVAGLSGLRLDGDWKLAPLPGAGDAGVPRDRTGFHVARRFG